MRTLLILVFVVAALSTRAAADEGFHGDLFGGVLAEFNGLTMPNGGAEAGIGLFLHGGIHPAGPITLSLGVEATMKGDGNYGWGFHSGIGIATELKRLTLGIELLLGYHGEYRTVDLTGAVFKNPVVHHGFVLGVGPECALNLLTLDSGSTLQLFIKPEIALVFSPAHSVPEWLVSPLVGIGGEL